MKRLILILSIFAGAISSYAQNHAVFTFNDPSEPKPVYRLGMDPEFPFLRNLPSRQAVLSAMQASQRDGRYSRQVQELNELLVATGFTRGIKDVTLASIAPYEVEPGTTGNMGSGHFNYIYAKMSADHSFKAWKVTADNGNYITFLSPCGNTFYPGAYVSNPTASLNLLPITTFEPMTVEKTAEFTGEKPACEPCKPKCEPCEPVVKCDCECEPHHHHHHYYSYHHHYHGRW